MAWCHQATSHYLSQCWPRSLLPFDVTRPHWVNNKIQMQASHNTRTKKCNNLMSWHGSTFCIIGPLWGESTDDRWILLTKDQWCRPLMLPFMLAWTRCWTSCRVDGDLRCHDAHVTSLMWHHSNTCKWLETYDMHMLMKTWIWAILSYKYVF